MTNKRRRSELVRLILYAGACVQSMRYRKVTMKYDNISDVTDTASYKSNNTASAVQVEVSHGSTSNQASMYQSQNETESSTKTFWCDFIFILFLFAASLFLMLFWYNNIPELEGYFKAHPHDKRIVIAFTCVVIAVVLSVFVFRCVQRTRYSKCHRRITSICPKPKCTALYDHFDNEDTTDNIKQYVSSDLVKNTINPKLIELPEDELSDLKRILLLFLSYHHDSDWLFSPSSTSAISRKGFSENTLFQQIEQSVKLRFSIKVILVGSPNVGKTSVFHRVLYDRFSEYYMATLGADLAHVCLHLFPGQPDNHVLISLQLWDIAGSERFSELAHVVYKDATAFIVICDVSDSNYVTQATPWVRDITSLKYEPYVGLFLNKIDLENKTSTLNCQAENEFNQFDSYCVSAKTGENVLENVMQVLVKSILHEINKLL